MFETKEFTNPLAPRGFFTCAGCGELNPFFADSFNCDFCEEIPPQVAHLKLSFAARLRWHLLGTLKPKAHDIDLCYSCIWRNTITNCRDEDTAMCEGCYSFSCYEEDYQVC